VCFPWRCRRRCRHTPTIRPPPPTARTSSSPCLDQVIPNQPSLPSIRPSFLPS
jgi:hypothetical protein